MGKPRPSLTAAIKKLQRGHTRRKRRLRQATKPLEKSSRRLLRTLLGL